MPAYADAVTALYQAPFADFVAARKRLAAELKAEGDKEGAARLSKAPRPPVSAWAVNQLWWKAREDFEELIAVAGRVKGGDRDASKTHRQQLARLREQAGELLREAGNAAAEATLRRVTTTLSAIAAQGDFAPDLPGALWTDRDPPGFEALGITGASARPGPQLEEPVPAGPRKKDDAQKKEDDARKREAEAEERRLEAERRRVEAEERERRRAERERLSAALRDARALEKSQLHERARLQRELDDAERSLSETQASRERLEQELANL